MSTGYATRPGAPPSHLAAYAGSASTARGDDREDSDVDLLVDFPAGTDILDDIATAITSIHSHLRHGPISVEIVMDAVAMRLLEIGEAVKGISPGLTATEPDVPWSDIAGTYTTLYTNTVV
jgi:hypothetical protein